MMHTSARIFSPRVGRAGRSGTWIHTDWVDPESFFMTVASSKGRAAPSHNEKASRTHEFVVAGTSPVRNRYTEVGPGSATAPRFPLRRERSRPRPGETARDMRNPPADRLAPESAPSCEPKEGVRKKLRRIPMLPRDKDTGRGNDDRFIDTDEK